MPDWKRGTSVTANVSRCTGDSLITTTGDDEGSKEGGRPRRLLLRALTLASLSFGLFLPASAQFAEESLVLRPAFGGPSDSFTATYDVNDGGCRDPDGKMVHFYWFGGASSITVIGKVPLMKCVASLEAVPPPGTPPGQYTVGADLFFPGGPQRPQNGTYRVDSSARPRSPSSKPPPGSSPSNVSGPGAVTGAPNGDPAAGEAPAAQSRNGRTGPGATVAGLKDGGAVANGAADQSPGTESGRAGRVAGAAEGGASSSAAPGAALDPSGTLSDASAPPVAAGESPDCGLKEIDCRAEALETAAHRRDLLPLGLGLALVLLGALAGFAWTKRPKATNGAQRRLR